MIIAKCFYCKKILSKFYYNDKYYEFCNNCFIVFCFCNEHLIDMIVNNLIIRNFIGRFVFNGVFFPIDCSIERKIISSKYIDILEKQLNFDDIENWKIIKNNKFKKDNIMYYKNLICKLQKLNENLIFI